MKTSIKNGSLAVSLRGSLASEFMQLSAKPDVNQQTLKKYLLALVQGSSPDLLLSYDTEGRLVVGKRSERGMFPPNW